MKNLLEINELGYYYHTNKDEIEAIKNISFNVKAEEFISIVGPSGCGKTTLLSLIAGLLTPSTGTILLNDAPVNFKANKIGYMFQRDNLFEWRNIWQNVTLGLELQKKKKDSEQLAIAERLLEKYDLKNFKKSKPSELSGGMRQRAALIRTLTMDPEILLLDEPFSALDFQTRLKVCDDVYDIIRSEKKTAILVTHDISEAISMSDRVVILTKRPAVVKTIEKINFKEKTPLLRRENPDFSPTFEKIWRIVSSENKN